MTRKSSYSWRRSWPRSAGAHAWRLSERRPHHVTGSNPRGGVNTILRLASPGSIVLAHDGGPEPNASLMRQLDRLVASMTDAGYSFVTVSELLATSARAALAASVAA